MTQYAFHVNVDNCIGCKTCGIACMEKNDLVAGQKYRRIYLNSVGAWTQDAAGIYIPQGVYAYSLPAACNHCANPACVDVCPSGAMTKDEVTGIVTTDHDVCIACSSCAQACPYGIPFVDEEKGYTLKCDFCQDQIANGELPTCVASCSVNALDFGDFEELKAKYPNAVQQIDPLPDAAATNPSLLITPPRKYTAGAAIVNFNMPEELGE